MNQSPVCIFNQAMYVQGVVAAVRNVQSSQYYAQGLPQVYDLIWRVRAALMQG